ncbi:hypothetical protein WELLINGTON_225 [Erwinia phage Wellington]|jgi:hypothetical protein|uniref:Uncharacterized protein n=2 Tax=Wellingtonvirus wellington TaxID=2734153 RepID=A0A1B2IE67_9CAUD|nr:hypothetical protein BIZ80_gp074 [Erwinia phage vB_EamM_Kwan]YP_009806709.1 hypothetical protein HOT70_gp076 [Erwinia phage Wellington]ANZ49577.1 hypothetical protein KWAN_225 [Erwinia phage vB_EamM_Kwan]AXF51351.1 hypothetical protein WELLINGTON_225 [Erwinia phage Wellington]
MKTPTTLERAVARDLFLALACVLGQLAYTSIAVLVLYHYTKVDLDDLLAWWFTYLGIGLPLITAYVVDYVTTLEERSHYGRRLGDIKQ